MVSDERIAEIRARADAATPGPWGRYGWPDERGVIRPLLGAMESEPGLSIGSVDHTEPLARFSGYLLPVEANADFVAHARQDVPYLLDALAAAQAEVQALRAALNPSALADEIVSSVGEIEYQPNNCAQEHPDGLCISAPALLATVENFIQAALDRALLAPEPQGSRGGEG